MNLLLGLYSPGTSPVHRAAPGLKLAVLAAVLLLLAVRPTPPVLVAVAVGLALTLLVARIRPGLVADQLRPLAWFVVPAAAFQAWAVGPADALVLAGALTEAVAAAATVTLTTRTSEMLDTVVDLLRPLRRVGVDPERVGLVLALTLRSVPVVADLAAQAQQARTARGAPRSLRALGTPLAIRTFRYADQLGEALAARGVDDQPAEEPEHA